MYNKWKNSLLFLAVLLTSQLSSAAQLKTFEFTIDGFTNGGSVTGSFSGRDLDGDGYLSSFIFSQDIDMDGTGFENGFAANEVISASATFNGLFDDDNNPDTPPVMTTFNLMNDLTSIDDLFFDMFPLDLFFVLNYQLGSGVLGDDAFEGLVFGQADGEAPLGLGKFLPAPLGILFDSPNDLPGGSTLTSALINNGSDGNPCENSTCGAIHTVLPDISVGGAELTNSLAIVREVSSPHADLLLICSMICIVVARKYAK